MIILNHVSALWYWRQSLVFQIFGVLFFSYLFLFYFYCSFKLCRSNKIEEECSDADGAIKKDEHLEKDSFDFANQEDIDISNKVRLKNDSIPSTSKQDVEPRWKIQVGKKHQTYSGPLLPSSMHNNSSERGRTSERFSSFILISNSVSSAFVILNICLFYQVQ